MTLTSNVSPVPLALDPQLSDLILLQAVSMSLFMGNPGSTAATI